MHLIIESIIDALDENQDPCKQVTAYGFDPTTEALQVVTDYVATVKVLSRADVAAKLDVAAKAGVSTKGADVLKDQGASPATIKSVLFNRSYLQLFIPATDPLYGTVAVGQTLVLDIA